MFLLAHLSRFPRGDICEITLTNFKNHLLQNHWTNFNETWHKASLDVYKFNQRRVTHFPRGDNYKIAKINKKLPL